VIHWTSYACWPAALIHSIGTGSDTRQPWLLAVLLACLAAVLASIGWRLVSGAPETAGARAVTAVAAVVALGVLFGWTVAGPLQAGWAARAGTPPDLLGSPATSGAATSGAATPTAGGAYAPGLTPPFTAQLSGTTAQTPGAVGGGSVEVFIDGSLTGGATGRLDVTISGTPLAGGGVDMDSSAVSVGTAGHQDLYQGQLSSLNGSSFVAQVSDGSGNAMTLTGTLAIDRRDGTVAGTVTAAPGRS
ncbi:MAG TPA: hypothetical protein VHA57_13315, partial [Actinomycetota bacterium]|nr:hypothetical protein [Actinomycetota bacterium]